jgi:hypothetical protein
MAIRHARQVPEQRRKKGRRFKQWSYQGDARGGLAETEELPFRKRRRGNEKRQ